VRTDTRPSNTQEHSDGEDILSSLFQASHKCDDESQHLVDLHSRLFKNAKPLRVADYPVVNINNQVNGRNEKVDMKLAEELLNTYRSMSGYFPFVKVSEDATVGRMSSDHPFLFLSILRVAASKNMKLHKKLDTKFRQVLSDRVVMHGGRNLDYLQGLLVYIAW
jgi:hypothetical protein